MSHHSDRFNGISPTDICSGAMLQTMKQIRKEQLIKIYSLMQLWHPTKIVKIKNCLFKRHTTVLTELSLF